MGWNRADGGVGGLSNTQAAHMEVDGHLELATDAVVLSACGVSGDHTLQGPKEPQGQLFVSKKRPKREPRYRKAAPQRVSVLVCAVLQTTKHAAVKKRTLVKQRGPYS